MFVSGLGSVTNWNEVGGLGKSHLKTQLVEDYFQHDSPGSWQVSEDLRFYKNIHGTFIHDSKNLVIGQVYQLKNEQKKICRFIQWNIIDKT